MLTNEQAKDINNNKQASIAFYDDEKHDYQDFWIGRDYEHNSEIIALNKLLANKHFALTMDYGGGYGRIAPILLGFSDQLILVDPSTQQLNIAKKRLSNFANVEFVRVDQQDSVPAENNTLDLLVMVRVSHHLADPAPTFAEIHRALKPGGLAIIEIANEAHFINRIKYLTKLKLVPKESVPIGKFANGITDNTPFFNHNPKTITTLLKQNNLTVVDKLSVSNLRSKLLKNHMKMANMLKLETSLQPMLSFMDFGPSIFLLVKK